MEWIQWRWKEEATAPNISFFFSALHPGVQETGVCDKHVFNVQTQAFMVRMEVDQQQQQHDSIAPPGYWRSMHYSSTFCTYSSLLKYMPLSPESPSNWPCILGSINPWLSFVCENSANPIRSELQGIAPLSDNYLPMAPNGFTTMYYPDSRYPPNTHKNTNHSCSS